MKIVTTNNVDFPYKWVSVYSYADIQGIPRNENNNVGENDTTVPCVCYFNRWNLMRSGKFNSDLNLIYPDAPPVNNLRHEYKIGVFSFNFTQLEWIDSRNGQLRLPSWAVYFALPICKASAPNVAAHPDVMGPKERLFRFPQSEFSKNAMKEIIDVQEQLARTPNDPNLTLTTEHTVRMRIDENEQIHFSFGHSYLNNSD